MKNKLLFILLAIIFISPVYSLCSQGQIDINTAPLSELEKIYGIGPVKAQAIIDSRTYSSLDDLVKAYGIGEKTLEKIKSEGLACVSDESYKEENQEIISSNPNSENLEENKDSFISESDYKTIDSNKSIKENKIEDISSQNQNIQKQRDIQQQEIVLNPTNPKDIKTNENSNFKEDKKYAIYSLVVFCIFLGFLFILDKKKKQSKNEFR